MTDSANHITRSRSLSTPSDGKRKPFVSRLTGSESPTCWRTQSRDSQVGEASLSGLPRPRLLQACSPR
ncbi:hypothetical protein V5799_025648 [Amblyomma americanum]|uniref:Uncharacterized protein n=1 Tax=Amblyomma americanum TaxID=6943 RepID=A0AAQ4E8N7_AMBAM